MRNRHGTNDPDEWQVATLDPAKPRATAVAIKGGLFEAVGGDEDIMRLADTSARVINLENAPSSPV